MRAGSTGVIKMNEHNEVMDSMEEAPFSFAAVVGALIVGYALGIFTVIGLIMAIFEPF